MYLPSDLSVTCKFFVFSINTITVALKEMSCLQISTSHFESSSEHLALLIWKLECPKFATCDLTKYSRHEMAQSGRSAAKHTWQACRQLTQPLPHLYSGALMYNFFCTSRFPDHCLPKVRGRPDAAISAMFLLLETQIAQHIGHYGKQFAKFVPAFGTV